MAKSDYEKLCEMRCPTKGCRTKLSGEKMGHVECPKCKGQWDYVIYGPLESCWRETVKPAGQGGK